MDSIYTIKEISRTTGLKEQFIRKCIMEAKGKFDKYVVSRGKNNTINFDSNALVLFDKVKQKKENGWVIPDIIGWLFQNNDTGESVETKNNQQNNQTDKDTLKSFEQMYKEVILAKDETIKTKDEHILNLNKQLLLLTDGRDPEVFKKAQDQKQEELLKLKFDLNTKDEKLKYFSELEKKIIELEKQKQFLELQQKQELETKKMEIEKIRQEDKEKQLFKQKEEEELKKLLKEKEDKKNSILKELETLEGKWFISSQRKELLKQLKEIS